MLNGVKEQWPRKVKSQISQVMQNYVNFLEEKWGGRVAVLFRP